MINRIRNLPIGVKASLAFFIANIISKGISYLTTPLYTRLLTTDEYGQVSLYLTWLQIFGIVAMFSLSAGVFNTGMVDYPNKRSQYSFSMLILSNVITIISFLILTCVFPFVKSVIGVDFQLIVLMFIVFLFQPAYNFWVCHQRFEYNYKPILLWSIICTITAPAISIVVINCFTKGERLYPRLFGGEIPLILIYSCFYIYLGIKNKWRVDKSFWKGALVFNAPLIPHYLSTYLLGSADKIMISNIVSDSATAFYSVAYSVAAVVSIVWSAVNGSLIPYIYQKCKEKQYEAINKITLPILTVFFWCCILIIMLAPEVVKLMATNEYYEAIYVIPPIVGGVFFQVQYYIYANIVYYYKKPKYVMVGSVSAVIINILLNLIFINKFGYIAAGFTTLFCYMVQAIIDYIAMRKVCGHNVYNMKYIIFLSVAIILVSLISLLTYSMFFIRYGIVLFLIIFMFVFRKKITAYIIPLFKPKKTE